MGYNLEYINDEDLFEHVKKTVNAYSFKMSLRDFNKNIVDPIKLTFDSYVYKQGIELTIKNEVLRQLDKSNSNHIGYFHQNIFKYIGEDWFVPQRGYDIECPSKSIFVEMKNKHNTMNSSSSAKTYMRFLTTLLQNPDSTCLLVEVIAKKSQDIPWVITLDGVKQNVNRQLRRVSIDKFYELVTGDKNSFLNLCSVLPKVLMDVIDDSKENMKDSSVYSELDNLSDSKLKSLYLLAFKQYEGFNNLDFYGINDG